MNSLRNLFAQIKPMAKLNHTATRIAREHVLVTGDDEFHDDDIGSVVDEIKKKAEMKSPLLKAAQDILVLIDVIPYIFRLALPLKPLRKFAGVPPGPSVFWRDYVLVALVSLLQVPIALGFVPAFLVLPGWAFVTFYAIVLVASEVFNRLLWGPIWIHSRTTGFDEKKFPHERWVFLNGIVTGRVAAQRSVDNLAATFQRPVFGVYNRTFGLIGDLVECLIQRSFGYSTFDVRVAAESLQGMLVDEEVHKIVVVAHSQGGIITSLVLDHLYSVVPAQNLRKMEVYTFGSAAAQFHDPLIQIKPNVASQRSNEIPVSSLPRMPKRELSEDSKMMEALARASSVDAPTNLKNRVIPYIEHYCNETDPVPRWGVLYHVARSSGTTYAGRVFVREGASGHFFDQHYLETMFPMDQILDQEDSHLFMNNTVRFAERGVLRTKSDVASSPSVFPEGSSGNDGAGSEHVTVRVRDLSRLWRYVGGREPDDESRSHQA